VTVPFFDLSRVHAPLLAKVDATETAHPWPMFPAMTPAETEMVVDAAKENFRG
jgi:hypothetical protein